MHLNGTSANDLLDQHRAAMTAVEEAIEALHNAAPNARDYYPQGDDTYGKARAEYIERLRKLDSVANDLLELAMHISNHIK